VDARRHRNVHVAGVRRDTLDRPGLPPELAADHPRPCAVVFDDLGDLRGGDVLVAGLGHLERRGEVGPELEPVHPPARIALRHLLVHDPAPGGHPLDVPCAQLPLVAEAIAVLHGSREHVGDRLDPPMRVPGEAREVILRVLVAKVVEQQERIEVGRGAEAERALQPDAGTFDRGLGLPDALDRSNGHGRSPSRAAGVSEPAVAARNRRTRGLRVRFRQQQAGPLDSATLSRLRPV
jgi:hypothetical protein